LVSIGDWILFSALPLSVWKQGEHPSLNHPQPLMAKRSLFGPDN